MLARPVDIPTRFVQDLFLTFLLGHLGFQPVRQDVDLKGLQIVAHWP